MALQHIYEYQSTSKHSVRYLNNLVGVTVVIQ